MRPLVLLPYISRIYPVSKTEVVNCVSYIYITEGVTRRTSEGIYYACLIPRGSTLLIVCKLVFDLPRVSNDFKPNIRVENIFSLQHEPNQEQLQITQHMILYDHLRTTQNVFHTTEEIPDIYIIAAYCTGPGGRVDMDGVIYMKKTSNIALPGAANNHQYTLGQRW